jgi:hypothetical protein
MLLEARRRVTRGASSVEFRLGNAMQLEFRRREFRWRTERTRFQHLDRADTALAEMVRVTKHHWHIVVINTDWGMHAIHGADPRLTSRITESCAQSAANCWSVTASSRSFTTRDDRTARHGRDVDDQQPERATRSPIPEMASVATHVGAISTHEAEQWLAQLAAAATRGNFFWVVTMFAVGATRPSRLTTHGPPPHDARNLLLKSQCRPDGTSWQPAASNGT